MIKVIERPNIILKEIDFDFKQDTNNSKLDEVSNDTGRKPYVEIGKQIIESTSIISLSLYNDQFLPRINMKFKDSTGHLLDSLFPLDNSIIKTFIQSSNDNLMPIRMDFKIMKYNPVKSKSGDNNDIIIELEGVLDVDNLYNSPYKSYDDTSYNVIKQLAAESQLGFSSNMDNTDDKMVWINPAELNMNFIQYVVNFAFKSVDSFLYAYVDFYYNLNYVDIETALNDDITGQTALVGSKFVFDKNNTTALNQTSELVLLNHPENIDSNFYINKYDIANNSTSTNMEIGYSYFNSYYDTNGNIIYDIKLDTISTTGPDGNNIIMKGGLGDVTALQVESTTSEYNGKIDTDNVHKYFLYAYKSHELNLKFLQKIRMKIIITSANFNLYRYQKVKLRMYRINEFTKNQEKEDEYKNPQFESKNSDTLIKDEDKMNQRLSGEWLITSINYLYGTSDKFEQEVVLVRRELSFNNNDFKPNRSY